MTAPCPEEECDATFTGSRAHIDVVEHFSAVHIHGTVASEPAEPTTRPQADVIDKAADAIRDAYEVYAPVPGVLRSEAPNIARALADLGLLADPAQTTELEELRLLNRRMQRQVDRLPWRQRDYERARLELRKLNDAMARKHRVIAKRESERDLALWLHAEAAWRVAGFDVLTVALARRNHQLTAERDERQARIEAATAELKKWDALATRESEWMPCRAALAALVGDQGKHLGENQAESGGGVRRR